MKRRLALAALLLLAVLLGAWLWLGPEAAAWSLRAALAPAGPEKAWARVPASAPGVASCRLQALLGSPIGAELRPEFATLAGLQGADLAWFEKRLEEVIVVHDGGATGYALGRPMDLSPLLVARFDERWGPIEGAAGRRGASDGLLALFPMEPGLVLATEARAAGRALQMASGSAPAHAPLPLDQPGEVLRARLDVTPQLRAQARRRADPRARPFVEGLASAELRVLALDEIEARLDLRARDERSAQAMEGLLRQLDAAARTARRAGALADALLGRVGALLRELPPLEIAREGAVVAVETRAGAGDIRPWLRRAIEAIGERS